MGTLVTSKGQVTRLRNLQERTQSTIVPLWPPHTDRVKRNARSALTRPRNSALFNLISNGLSLLVCFVGSHHETTTARGHFLSQRGSSAFFFVRSRLDTLPMPKLGTDRSTWYESSVGGESMTGLKRITTDPAVMGGKPCIRGLRVTVGTIVGLVATGHPDEEILRLYPYLEADDIREALSYAAWRAEEIEVPLSVP